MLQETDFFFDCYPKDRFNRVPGYVVDIVTG